MLEIKMISPEQRGILPEALRRKPAFVASSDGELVGYCSYDVSDTDTAYILALKAADFPPETAELLIRAVAVNLMDYFDYIELADGAGAGISAAARLFAGKNKAEIKSLLYSGCAGHA